MKIQQLPSSILAIGLYKIQLGQDPNKKDKYGKELINLSFVK